jgi:hypothetical protein
MRHFLRRRLGQTELPLSRGVLVRAFARALVGGAGAAHRLSTADRATVSGAVDLATIARHAHADFAAAARAAKEAEADVDGGVGRALGTSRRQRTCPTHASRRCCGEEAMAKIGRNDPCPCGSGKKHKRCCLAAPATQERPGTPVAALTESHQEICPCCVDELNERADHILEVLLAGRADEAETLCHDFLRDFPGQAEGIDLLSMTFELRGQRERALDLLRQASDIAHANPDYDAETRSLMRERIRELELSA